MFCVSLWTIVAKTFLRKSCTHANVINLEALQFRSCGIFNLLYSAFKVYRLNKLSLEKHYSNLPSEYFQKCMCHSKVGQPFNNVLDSTFVLHSKSPRFYGFKRSCSNTERKPKNDFFFMSDVSTINTTLIFDKKYADIRSFVSLMLILIKSFHNCLKSWSVGIDVPFCIPAKLCFLLKCDFQRFF